MNHFQICLGRTKSLSFLFGFLVSLHAVHGDAWDPLWTKTLTNGSGGLPTALSVTGDSLGNLFLAGRAGNPLPGADVEGLGSFVIKYSETGTQLWAKQFAAGSALDVVTDNANNLIVVGETNSLVQPSGLYRDAFVRKYDAGGNVLWTQQFGSPVSDVATAVDTDAFGNIYVSGYDKYKFGPETDGFLRKYDPSGTLAWERSIATPLGDRANAVTVDTSGNIFVGGFTDGMMASPDLGGTDAFLTKFDFNGNRSWTRQISGHAGDEIYDLTSDNSGNVYTAGYRGNSQGFMRKYNSLGQVVWQVLLPEVNVYSSISWDGIGSVYVAGSYLTDGPFLARYAEDGTLISSYLPAELSYTTPQVYADGLRGVFAANTDFSNRAILMANYEVVPEPTSMVALVIAAAAMLGSRPR